MGPGMWRNVYIYKIVRDCRSTRLKVDQLDMDDDYMKFSVFRIKENL